ncbi:MAG: DUF1501 domain-containing protein, partial [Verrucomicrobia bacterium]|nr:DUF1501 domain-containing protein [Verrucomicrobiota bacterium]
MNVPRIPCSGPLSSRRDWLRVGGLSAFGLSLSDLLDPSNRALGSLASTGTGSRFGQAKACILIFLAGGPPQHETFDPKPDAPSEIRDTFRSIATRIPGT